MASTKVARLAKGKINKMKNPLHTFIGGLVIGGFFGSIAGATGVGLWVLSLLN